jgi:hypothetical protein
MRARVVDVAFQGPTLEVRLAAIGSSLTLLAIDTSVNLPAKLCPGRELWCVWDPAHLHALGNGP